MKIRNNTYTAPLLLLLIGLLVSLVWGYHASTRNEAIKQREFAERVGDLEKRLLDRFNRYERGLHAARGAVLAVGEDQFDYAHFLSYVSTWDMQREFPGARGVGFIRPLRTEQQPAFQARMRRDGLPDFTIHDLAAHGDEHFIIQFIEPLENNRQALGLDIASEENRLRAARQAISSGKTMLTAPLTLVQAAGSPKRGYLLLLAVPRQAGDDPSRKLFGLVYSPLVIDEVLQDFGNSDYAFMLTDVGPEQGRVELFDSTAKGKTYSSGMAKTISLRLYGRDWEVAVRASDDFVRRLNLVSPVREAGILLLVSLLVSALLFAYLKNLQKRLRESVSSQLGDAAPEGMMVVDGDGVVTYANRRLLSMFGYERSEIEGKKMELLLPERFRQHHVADRSGYDRIPRSMGQGRYLTALRKDGEEFPVEVSLGPLQLDNRRMVVAMVVDITQRRKMEARLRESEARWSFALEGSGDGVWDWNLQTGQVSLSRTGIEMFGYDQVEGESRDISEWNALMPPEDQQRWKDMLRQFFRDREERFALEYRVRCKDGSYKWILTRGMVVARGEDGKVVRMIGVHTDIDQRKQAEQALQESERKFRTLAANIPGLLYRGDADWRTEYISHSEAICGYNRDELNGFADGWRHIVHPDDRKRILQESAHLVREEGALVQEYRIQHKNGEIRWVSDHKRSLFDAGGAFAGVDGVVFDITDRKRADDEVAHARERLRRGQMFANIGTWDWNIQTGELYWTDRIAPLFGYPLGDLDTTYENFLNAVHPDDRQAVTDAVTACVERDAPYEIEHRVVWPDGTVRWLLERGAVVRDAAGKPLQMLGVVQDIHDRKTAEEELLRLKHVMDSTLDMIFMFDSETLEFVYLNQGAVQSMGYAREELLRLHPYDIKPLMPEPVFREKLAPLLSGEKEAIHFETLHRRKDGTDFPVEIALQLVRNGKKGGRFIAIVRDITRRKRDEQALRESEQRWSFAVEGAGDGIWDWDIATGRMPLSGHYEEMLGFSKGELEPTIDAWVASVYPDDLPRAQDNLQEYLEGRIPNYQIELRLRCKDGGYKWILCRGTVVERDRAGKPSRMIGIHTDIQQRKENEERIMLFARVFDSSEQGIGITNGEGVLIYTNSAHEKIFGYGRGEMVGMHVSQLHPESEHGAIGQLLGAVASEGSWHGQLKALRKGGGEMVTANRVGAIRDQDGKPVFLFNLLYDYGPELARQNELLAARDAAEAANRAKSDFLSSMSHELRTPLNAVIGFGQLLEVDSGLGEDQQDSVKEIIKAGKHLLELVNEVLDLAKIEAGNIELSLEPVSMAELVGECRSLVKPLADGRNITIACQDCGVAHVRADRVRLKQVLLNLLSNAIKYNRDGGGISITKQAGRPGYLKMAVSDTGKGIPAARMAELFQPFNRLEAEHSAIEGTGIGLSITRRLVEMMGGEIGAESVEGQGSTFWVELPETAGHDGGGTDNDDSSRFRAQSGESSVVLYIEDNPVNLKLVSQILARRPQVRLLTAHLPGLGIELAKAHQPDLILLDINMPDMDGYQVLKAMKANPNLKDIPVVAVTANALQRDIERGMQAGFAAYLTKPLDVERFLDTVDRLLLEYARRQSGENADG